MGPVEQRVRSIVDRFHIPSTYIRTAPTYQHHQIGGLVGVVTGHVI